MAKPVRLASEYCLDEAILMDELNQGIVHLNSEIDEFTARDLIRNISYSIRLGNQSLKLFINSPGGGVGDSMAIYDHIREQEFLYDEDNGGARVVGIVRGHAASAASMIVLQACHVRLATRNSRLHLHEPAKWTFGPQTAGAIRDDAKELTELETIILGIIASRAHKSVDELREELGRRDTWMSADEAYQWGLIDGVRP